MSTIVIADKHALIRFSIKILLEQSGHTIVAETKSGLETLQTVSLLAPQLLILELELGDPHGLDVIARLSSCRCPSRILALTACDAENYLVRCLRAGASGFVSKTADVGELQRAVKTLLRGEKHFPALRPKRLNLPGRTATPSHYDTTEIKLTRREKEVLRLLAQGHDNQDIAKLLSLSHKTVSANKIRLLYKFHTTHLFGLLDAAQRAGHL